MEYSYYTEMEMQPNCPLVDNEEKIENDCNSDNENENEDMNEDMNEDNDSDVSDLSDGRMCRYCFCEVLEEANYSNCQCKTAICRDCLEKELCLTEGRQDHKMKCTVCQYEYIIDYLNESPQTCSKILCFSIKETLCCSHLSIQGRIASIRERLALLLLMCFLSLWTTATTYSIINPGIDKFDGFAAELLVYLFLVFMDFCVGFSMIWFVKLVETLQLTLPFSLGLIHIIRCIAVIILRFVIMGINDAWKFAANLGMIVTSFCVVSTCCKLFISIAYKGYNRMQMRNVEIMVNNKGPFRLRDIDQYHSRNRDRNRNRNQNRNQNRNRNRNEINIRLQQL